MALLGANLANGPPRTTLGRASTTGMPDASPAVNAISSCATLLAKYADVGSCPRWADSSRGEGDSLDPQVTDELVTTTRSTPAAAAASMTARVPSALTRRTSAARSAPKA